MTTPEDDGLPPADAPAIITIEVDPDAEPTRLDRLLADRLPDHSRSRIARWIKSGMATVDGASARPSAKVLGGQRVRIEIPPDPPIEAQPTEMPLVVLYEDADLVVIDKPAGLVMHPAPGHEADTLINGLLARYGVLSPVGAPQRPGVVHRIDALTSGAVVVARTERAHQHLAAQFARHTVERSYRALVWAGRRLEDEGTLTTPYGRHPRDRRKFSGLVRASKQAITHWKVLDRAHGCAWLECRLETGRTHQIRVHLSEAGAPLLGDPMYGRRRSIERPVTLRQKGPDLGLKRQALHARHLGFEHPVTGELMRFTSPLPEDLAGALEALGIEAS